MKQNRRSLVVLAALLAAAVAPVAAQTTTVIVVRHAEKVDDSTDPLLSAAGAARAESLARALADAGVSVIYTTQYVRTRATAAPLAARSAIEPVVIAPTRGAAAHAAELAARIREHDGGRTVLIVGHSNTVPLIVQALGGADVGSIGDDEYDHLFIVQLGADGTTTIRTRY
jgi:broad specificity phosphatase PhoE